MPSVSHSDAPFAPSELASLLGPFLFRQPDNDRPAVLAISGGPDSTLLLRGAAGLRPFGEVLPLVTATVDHGLRPESAAEAEQVAAWSEAIGIPHRTLRWHGEKPRSGLQEAAREARYSLLAELARDIGAARVLTAHTLDDQAETMLMRLARGSGLSGLRGMAAETHLQGIVLASRCSAFAGAGSWRRAGNKTGLSSRIRATRTSSSRAYASDGGFFHNSPPRGSRRSASPSWPAASEEPTKRSHCGRRTCCRQSSCGEWRPR